MAESDTDKEQGSKEPGSSSARHEVGPFTASDDIETDDTPRMPTPRRRRHPIISLLVIGLSLYLMWFLRADLLYFFQPRTPTPVGQVDDALRHGRLKPNTYVTVHGAPDRKYALLLKGQFTGFDSFVPLLQSDHRVFVQRHRRKRESGRIVMGEHTGRVVPFDRLPYRKGVQRELERTIRVAHELSADALIAAKRTGQRTIVDAAGRTVTLDDATELWINVSYPNEWVIQLPKNAFAEEQARQRLAGLPLPYTEDAEPSRRMWRFVVLAKDEQLRQILEMFSDPSSSSGVVPRQVTYTARWDQLALQGDSLLIQTDDPARVVRYRTAPSAAAPSAAGEDSSAAGENSSTAGDKAKQLEAVTGTPVEVERAALRHISTGSPFVMPADARVIVVGDRPQGSWHYLLLYGILVLFMGVNAIALAARLRERRGKTPSAR